VKEMVPPPREILWQSVTKSPFSSPAIFVLGWQPFLKSLMPLHHSLILFFALYKFKYMNLCHKLAIKSFLCLLTVICISPLHAKRIIEFPWQKWLSGSAKSLLYRCSRLTVVVALSFCS